MSDKGKANANKWWKVQANSDGSAELFLYGAIGEDWWDDNSKTAKQFIDEIRALGKISALNIRINSYGGEVFEAMAMYNYLKGLSYAKTVFIDGIAASAASLVAMSGDKVVMPANAMMMVHNPSSLAWGESEDMRKTADVLDKIRSSMVLIYQAKTGKDEEEIVAMLDAETWLSASDALEAGFADEIVAPIEATASLNGKLLVITSSIGSTSLQDAGAASERILQILGKKAESEPTKNKGDEGMIKDLNELKAAHPDIFKAAFDEGVTAERERIKALEKLSSPETAELVTKAKYETFATAESCAIEAFEAMKASQPMKDRTSDAAGLNGIGGSPVEAHITVEASEMEEHLKRVKAIAEKKKGGHR